MGCVQFLEGMQYSLSSSSLTVPPLATCGDDDEGETHEIKQGEGGEQGDALMPLLRSRPASGFAGGPIPALFFNAFSRHLRRLSSRTDL